MFWRHWITRSKGYFVRITMVGFLLKGGGGGGKYPRRDIYIRKIES
jgi:hypothetical protein